MKKVIAFICILHVVFLHTNLKAQSDFKPGYIIQNSGDTVFGLIDLRINEVNNRKCVFNENKTQTITEYLPGDIKAYRFIDGKYYVSKQIFITPDSLAEMAFLEYLVEGKANLYILHKDNEQYFFLEKENEPLYAFKQKEKHISKEISTAQTTYQQEYVMQDNTFKGAMLYYFRDAPELRDEVYRLQLNQKNIINIAVDYHNAVCTDSKCIVYTKQSKTYFSLGLTAGIDYNSVKYSYNYGYYNITEQSSNLGYAVGINLDIYNPNFLNRFFETITLTYSSIDQHTSDEYREIHVLYKNLNLLANMYYCYNHFALQPYVGGGLFISKSLKSSIVYEETDFYPFHPAKTSLSINLALGTKYKISERFYSKLEFSYQPKIFERSEDYDCSTHTRNMFTTVSIMYTL